MEVQSATTLFLTYMVAGSRAHIYIYYNMTDGIRRVKVMFSSGLIH